MIRRKLWLATILGLILALPTASRAQNTSTSLPVAPRAPATTFEPDTNVVKLLRTTDRAQITRFVPKVFELKNANPYEVSKFIEDTVRSESGMIGTFANPENDYQGGLIVVVVPEYQLERIGDVIRELDTPGQTNASGTSWEFINLKHRSVEDPQFKSSLLAFGGADNEITLDSKTNSMMVTGVPSGVDAIGAALLDYDIPRNQISIGVKIYEVDVSNDATLGLNYVAWKNGPGRNLFKLDQSRIQINQRDSKTRGKEKTAGYSLDYSSEFFDFLVVKGTAQMVSELKGSVINGYDATFKVQDEILYYHVDQTDEGNRIIKPETAPRFTPAAAGQTIERFESGITLTIKPVIFRNNIDLTIETEIKDYVTFDDQGKPKSNDRRVSTEVRAVSGQEVLLAKLERTRDIHATRGIPILGSIPGFGYLFGGEIGGKKRTSIVEIGTPTIIAEGELQDDETELIDQIEGRKELHLPADEYFFDQYLIDRGLPPPSTAPGAVPSPEEITSQEAPIQ